MKHFTSEDWGDFVRQVTTPEQTVAMQRHLDKACKECSKTMVMWRGVLDISRKEADYQPPEGTIRAVKAYYGSHRPRESAPQVAKIAQLIYDTFRQPLPEGVRASTDSSRQLVYRLGNILVDMRMEPVAAPGRISLVGQVLRSAQADGGLKDVPVLLLRDKNKVAQTTTNDFGEFQFEFDTGQQLHLSIEIGQGIALLIALRNVDPRHKPSPSKGEA
jgi:hypothetical protein